MLNNILLGMSVFLQSLTWAICVCLILKERRLSKWKTFFALLILISVLNIWLSWIPFQSWQPVVCYFAHFIFVRILFKEPWKEILFLFCILYSTDVLMESMGFLCFGAGIVFHDPISDVNIILNSVVGFVGAIARVPWAGVFWSLQKTWEPSVYLKFYVFAIGQFVIQVIAMESVYMNHMGAGEPVRLIFEPETVWPYRLGIIFFLMLTALMYFVLFFNMKQEQIRRRIMLKSEILKRNIDYYRKNEASQMHLRKIRHDAGNHLTLVANLMDEDPESAEKYLEELKKEILKL